jgi:hypothetical protein
MYSFKDIFGIKDRKNRSWGQYLASFWFALIKFSKLNDIESMIIFSKSSFSSDWLLFSKFDSASFDKNELKFVLILLFVSYILIIIKI